MSPELVFRFFLGGLLVSAFAVLGDLLRPKSFAGVFGAAPSVALATLALAVLSHGAGTRQSRRDLYWLARSGCLLMAGSSAGYC